MKILILTALLTSAAVAAPMIDFRCETPERSDKLEVIFENGNLSYDDGRLIDVSVTAKSNNGHIQTISGFSRGLVFCRRWNSDR